MERDSVQGRIGTFLILLGVVLIVLFVLSDLGGQVDATYLLYGVGVVLLGFMLRWTLPRPERPPTNRFRIFRSRKQKKPRHGLFGSRKVEEASGKTDERPDG